MFFFKQKTAYDMRISDWSSDVCSSDLPFENAPLGPLRCRFGNRPSAISQTDLSGVGRFLFLGLVVDRGGLAQDIEDLLLRGRLVDLFHRGEFAREEIGRASCRERVCQYV